MKVLCVLLSSLSCCSDKRRRLDAHSIESPIKQDNTNQLKLEKSMLEESPGIDRKRSKQIKETSFMLLVNSTCVLLCSTRFIQLIIKNTSINHDIANKHQGHIVFYKLFYVFFQNIIMLHLNKKIMMMEYGNNIINNTNVTKVCHLSGGNIGNGIGV